MVVACYLPGSLSGLVAPSRKKGWPLFSDRIAISHRHLVTTKHDELLVMNQHEEALSHYCLLFTISLREAIAACRIQIAEIPWERPLCPRHNRAMARSYGAATADDAMML